MQAADKSTFLAGLAMFSAASPEDLESLSSSADILRLRNGQRAFMQGDPAVSAWWVCSGLVSIVKYAPSGRMTTLEVVLPGETFGTLASLQGHPYPAEAQCLGSTEVLRVPIELLKAVVQRRPELNVALLSEAQNRLVNAHSMRTLSGESVPQRILHVLLWMREKFGDEIPLTREAVAHLAGTTPETVIRFSRTLTEQLLVRSRRGRIFIVDGPGLEALHRQLAES
jgi:CRP-like cAMP-binding protein